MNNGRRGRTELSGTDEKRGLYIHIPFCASKCRYCNFYSRSCDEQTKTEFLSALCREISAVGGGKVSTVYIGGGTPSVLPEGSLERLFSALENTFDLSGVGEITVECNPDSASKAFFLEAARCGVNRVSMGCQSFVSEELAFLGRRHSPEQAKQAFFAAREAGFSKISLDLMLAIPFQTKESLLFSLEEIASLDPEHVSAYLLKVEPGTPFSFLNLPQNDDFSADLYLLASEFLTCKGFEHYEVSNFAKKGCRARHNSAYWQGKEYFAFGPGAYGYLNGKRFSVEADLQKYIAGNAEVQVEEVLSEADVSKEKLMLSLRTADGVRRSDLTEKQAEILSSLIPHGLAEKTEDRFFLTPRGFLVSNSILSEIF